MCGKVRSYLGRKRSGSADKTYVGLIHRLDRDVTGVCTFAKTPEAARWLGAQFSGREVRKEYIGVVRRWRPGGMVRLKNMLEVDDTGKARESASSDGDIDGTADGGKYCELECRPLCAGPSGVTAVLVRLLTGRRHQIRFQLAEAQSPLLGDPRYGSGVRDGSRKWIQRPALHAWRLRFSHPAEPHLPCEVVAPLPSDIAALLAAVGIPPQRVLERAMDSGFT